MKFCLIKHFVSYLLEGNWKNLFPAFHQISFGREWTMLIWKVWKVHFESEVQKILHQQWNGRIFKSLVKHFSISQQPFTALLKYFNIFLINSVTIPNIRTSQELWMCQVPVTLTIQDLSQQVFILYWNILWERDALAWKLQRVRRSW